MIQSKRIDTYIVLAAIAFMAVAVFIMGMLPWLGRDRAGAATVTTTDGRVVEAKPYTALEERGRRVYIREGCWYCHSQYVRPVTGEDRRWGPPSQEGEYAYDVPHLFGTRRIGPDLTREGGRVSDDWHYAHLFNPRMIVPDSIMPRFPWLFKGVDSAGKPVPTQDMVALVAYIQKLGANLGRWRKDFHYLQSGSSIPFVPVSVESALEQGKSVYTRRCAGCHGDEGDGRGPAAVFLTTKPRVFKDGIFEFRSTPSGSLPTDADLCRTVSMGVRGTAMPSWHELSETDRLFVVQYIKTFSEKFKREAPAAAIVVPVEPANTKESVARGKGLYEQMKCDACHGASGKGDGPSAATLHDDWGNMLSAHDFTDGGDDMKSGPAPQDVYKALSTGLDGTPMPSYGDFLKPEQRWDLVHYVMSFGPADSYLIITKQPK
jgi:cytochrome c oxidase cbb3-type subunit I/II